MNERDIFLEIVDLEANERSRRLRELCGDDEDLRHRVEALLEFHDRDSQFLEQPFTAADDYEVPIPEAEGTTIGRYKLLEKIGEGGFGIVYMAEQSEPVRRRVALKIIKLGMDTKQVIGRFEAERQALALMDHPNIAKVFDGGTSESGRPYFVMELVNGIPITQFCDEKRLDTSERIQLVSHVCQALQHAHQKGIIHRDIKPSNVLVTVIDDHPVPKIIDFGIAKATQQRLTERTVFTRFQHFIGTPAYMSPEQAAYSGVDIDTRSDVYSVGVLLYELLTSTTPISNESLRDAALDEVCRLIREEVSPRPSARLSGLGGDISTVAENRSTNPQSLQVTVRGELDWIVMQCLEKDRSRRYDSAAALASDLNAFLQNEPVQAAPPSMVYRTRKYLKRNWRFAAALSTVMATLILGTIVSFAGFLSANREVERNRRLLYANDVKLCGEAIRLGNIRQAEDFLTKHIPKSGEEDLRTFPWHYMWRQLNQFEKEIELESPAHDIVFSPNQRFAIVGGEAGCLSFWDFESESVDVAKASMYTISSLSLGADNIVALGGREGKEWETAGTVELWDTDKRKLIRKVELPPGVDAVRTVEFIPNTPTLMIATVKNLIAYDTESNEIRWRREFVKGGVGATATRDVVVSPDQKLVATSRPGGPAAIFILNAETGEEIGEPIIGWQTIRSLEFSLDGSQLIVGEIVLKDMLAMSVVDLETRTVTKLDSRFAVESLSVSPTDGTVAALNWQGQINLWDLQTRRRIGGAPAHANAVGAIRFSQDGKLLLTCGHDRRARMWVVADLMKSESETIGQGPGTVTWYAFPRDGRSLVSAGRGNGLKQWNVESGELTREFTLNSDKPISTPRMLFSPDDRFLAGASYGGGLHVWESGSGEIVTTLETGIDGPTFLQFPSSESIVVGGFERSASGYELTIGEWEIETGKQTSSTSQTIVAATSATEEELPGYPHYRVRAGGPADQTRISPDRTKYAIGFGSHVLYGEVATGEVIYRFESMDHIIVPVEFSDDGKLLAAADQSQKIRVWDVSTGNEVVEFETPTWPGVVAFAPDGNTLAAGYINGTLGFWDLRVEREILNLEAHILPLTTLQFSADGKTLASGGWDGEVRIWKTALKD